MLAVISPAKKLNFERTAVTRSSQPDFLAQADKLAKSARRLTRSKLAATMKLSASLADLNYLRFQAFSDSPPRDHTKQAALAFNGDTYIGLDAPSWDADDLDYAQDHLRILSGLYGLLRPLDLMQPYRLEMGARFSPPRRKDLYDFWGDQITDALSDVLSGHDEKTVINLASNEYFKSVRPAKLQGRIITPAFRDERDGESRIIGFFAKQARGMMARYIVQNRISNPDDLKDFELGGYQYRPAQSNGDAWVFAREQPVLNGKVAA
ncbi:MAG: peroxide stress protein YaaA [Alphaproteobacteria bacterium]|nr:peroxide stress protein YaaA [Alphaproteobacteria bacterium]